ncbi:MAG TPA: hypothetical protein V6D14_13190 [Coleofasciculaceae cyanobacterium]
MNRKAVKSRTLHKSGEEAQAKCRGGTALKAANYFAARRSTKSPSPHSLVISQRSPGGNLQELR